MSAKEKFNRGGITAALSGFFPLNVPELFPTSVRATAQRLCSDLARPLAALGSLQPANLTGRISHQSKPTLQSTPNVFPVLSWRSLFGVIVIWLTPETKGRPLA